MKRLYRIGDIAQAVGVSTKTLRLYGELGILSPTSSDPRTGYRLYGAEKFRELAEILNLRGVGLSLTDIRLLRNNRSTADKRRARLTAQRDTLINEIEERKQQIRQIDMELETTETSTLTSAVIVKLRKPFHAASLRLQVGCYEEIDEMAAQLASYVPDAFRGERSGVLWHQCAGSGQIDGEALIELRRPLPPSTRFTMIEIPSEHVACFFIDQGAVDTDPAYKALSLWCERNAVTVPGPKCELRHDGLLEVQYPISVPPSVS